MPRQFLALFLLLLPALAVGQSPTVLEGLAHLKDFTAGRSGSYDKTGGNADRLQMKAGETATLAEIQGPGEINHIWFTIATGEAFHLKKTVFRISWDPQPTPSRATP